MPKIKIPKDYKVFAKAIEIITGRLNNHDKLIKDILEKIDKKNEPVNVENITTKEKLREIDILSQFVVKKMKELGVYQLIITKF